MKAHRRTGYGVFDISRQIARRVQSEWEMVEQPDRPPALHFAAAVIPVARPAEPNRRREKRPLAA